MPSKSDLQTLAQLRLDDSLLLLQAGRWSSAYYLSGYSLELGIKACIATLFQPDAIPDKAFLNAIFTHKLEPLIRTAGLYAAFEGAMKSDSLLAGYWGVASKWTEESRYEIWDSISATAMIQAVSDPTHGVFQWVKRHW